MIVDIINKKRLGLALSKEELEFSFLGYLRDEIKDYQMSSLLMAICLKGMSDQEIFDLTKIFIDSGEQLDFSDVPGVKVDKHSTGGVGDKTTLVIVPIVAALGIPVIKMSGRGLGFTGGTIDKLESIPGFRTNLSSSELKEQVKSIHAVITGQTANLVPLDKKIYALRDVTGTVESIPLIATSIMSKKIAAGADKILIDIKVGKGALIKNEDDAKRLSDLMIRIGQFYHREVRTITSNMDCPLGYTIGNSLEVLEATSVLLGKEEGHFKDLCIDLATHMVSMAKSISQEEANSQVIESLASKKAYHKFLEIVGYQGGSIDGIVISDKIDTITSTKSGTLTMIDALKLGTMSVQLGAGREEKEDSIDPGVGIKLHFNIGETVLEGDVLCTLYLNKESKYTTTDEMFTIN